MRKAMMVAALLLAAGQAQADYQCSVKPQDDIVISPQTVQVVGASGNLVITPTGDVQQNGKAARSIPPRARKRSITRPHYVVICHGSIRVHVSVWKKAALRWIK